MLAVLAAIVESRKGGISCPSRDSPGRMNHLGGGEIDMRSRLDTDIHMHPLLAPETTPKESHPTSPGAPLHMVTGACVVRSLMERFEL